MELSDEEKQRRRDFVYQVEDIIADFVLSGENAVLTYRGFRKQDFAPYDKFEITLTHPQGTRWNDLTNNQKVAVVREALGRDFPYTAQVDTVVRALIRQAVQAGPGDEEEALGKALYRGMTKEAELFQTLKRLTKENERLRRENDELRRKKQRL